MNSPYEQLAAEYEPPRNVTIKMTEAQARIYLEHQNIYSLIDEARQIVRAKWKRDAELQLERLYSILCEATAVFEDVE